KIIITTPESFDSLLCRGKTQDASGHILADITGLIIDEIHLLYGNARGEQLRWLTQRLINLRRYAHEKKWTRNTQLQIIGLSATLSDPLAVADFFRISDGFIAVKGERELESLTVSCE